MARHILDVVRFGRLVDLVLCSVLLSSLELSDTKVVDLVVSGPLLGALRPRPDPPRLAPRVLQLDQPECRV